MSHETPEDILDRNDQTVAGVCPYCGGNHYYGHHSVASDDFVYNNCTTCGEWSRSKHDVTVNGPA